MGEKEPGNSLSVMVLVFVFQQGIMLNQINQLEQAD